MNKLLVATVLLVTATACTPSYDTVHPAITPPELKDCQLVSWTPTSTSPTLYVVRCPNSTTSVNWEQSNGKSTIKRSTITIDGQDYELTEK